MANAKALLRNPAVCHSAKFRETKQKEETTRCVFHSAKAIPKPGVFTFREGQQLETQLKVTKSGGPPSGTIWEVLWEPTPVPLGKLSLVFFLIYFLLVPYTCPVCPYRFPVHSFRCPTHNKIR